MESVEKKLHYRIRVHDVDEEDKLLKLYHAKNRRVGGLFQDETCEWIEFESVQQLVNYRRYSEPKISCDYMVRFYFNTDHRIRKLKEEIRELFKEPLCGNDNCSKYEECLFSPLVKNRRNAWKNSISICEYQWRCILNDEYNYRPRKGEL